MAHAHTGWLQEEDTERARHGNALCSIIGRSPTQQSQSFMCQVIAVLGFVLFIDCVCCQELCLYLEVRTAAWGPV